MEIRYSRGDTIESSIVIQKVARNFEEFVKQLDKDRSPKKGLQYICAPMKNGRRNAQNAEDCAFLAFDCDGFAEPKDYKTLLDYMQRFECLVYQTHNSTQDTPRARVILPLAKAYTRNERQSIGYQFQKEIEFNLGAGLIDFDKSVYRAEQPIYTPPKNATFHYFKGNLLNIEPAHIPLEQEHKTTVNESFIRECTIDTVNKETFDHLENALTYLSSDNYSDWVNVGLALAYFKGTQWENQALRLWHMFSSTSEKYDTTEVDEKWEHLKLPTNTSYKAIFAKAQRNGWINPKTILKAQQKSEKNPNKIPPNEMAKLFAETLGYWDDIAKGLDNTITVYNGKFWESISDSEIGLLVSKFFDNLGINYTANKIRNLIETLKFQIPDLGEENSEFIAFDNGLINKKNGTFTSHNKKYFLRACSPIEYDPTKKDTPVFDNWIEFISNNDIEKANVIKAALYMILANRYDWQFFIELVGVGGSGKSVFTNLASFIVGHNNAASRSLDDIDKARGREALDTARLIIIPDQEQYRGQGAGLKGITGLDLMRIDPKHKKPYAAIIKAIVIMAHNGTVNFTERNNGIERRRVLIKLDREIQAGKQDLNFSKKLEQESGAIVNKLLKEFDNPEAARLILANARNSKDAISLKQESDHTVAFAAYFNTLPTCTGLRVGTKRNIGDKNFFYALYLQYCEAYGHYPLSANKFKEAITTAFKTHKQPHKYQTIKRGDKGFFTNVVLKSDKTEDLELDFGWLEDITIF